MIVTRTWMSAAVVAGALASMPALVGAQNRPANATGQCKDGSFTTAKTKQGACTGHDGVQTWFADEKSTVKSDAKAAGKSTEDAAKSAGKATEGAAKVAGKATANGAEKAAKATKEGTKTAAKATGKAATSAANAIKPKPSDAPADATAKCKDGSYSKTTEHQGACAGHGGVADWYK